MFFSYLEDKCIVINTD